MSHLSIPTASLVTAQARKRADETGVHDVWDWMEANATIVYPIVALVIVGLILGALFASWRGEELDAEHKAELKEELLALLRRRVSGVSADAAAAELQVDVLIAARLLNELVDAELAAATQSQPVQYRLRYRN